VTPKKPETAQQTLDRLRAQHAARMARYRANLKASRSTKPATPKKEKR
jgi:hypothetical protein